MVTKSGSQPAVVSSRTSPAVNRSAATRARKAPACRSCHAATHGSRHGFASTRIAPSVSAIGDSAKRDLDKARGDSRNSVNFRLHPKG